MNAAEIVTKKLNVMKAVMLRDMRTRFFNHGLGFALVPLWPLVHIFIVIVINIVSGRTAPYGESPMLYFATGLIPTLTFIYISRFMSVSLLMNSSMLSFPIVKVTDILFGRAILEVIAAMINIALVWIIFAALGIDPYPNDPLQATFAFLALIFLAVGIGTIVGTITQFLPIVATGYGLMGIVFYISSGALFVAPNLPDQIAIPLSYNPVLQCVEWMRVAFYEGYSDRLLNREYVLSFALGALFVGLTSERLSRRILLDVT
ncbi:ABC transporter permease [Rhizobium sp. YK2]|uniref:ABC transporter permease n=1 Tax=Rhizobium sp. YK2 TaxID=1860096 RepID=UPI00084CAE9D|nr:ABC transporter permease [Rhizobium sp. YK2]OEC99629.1 capsular biosynthesis protein [Rhizobium sp. YK2]